MSRSRDLAPSYRSSRSAPLRSRAFFSTWRVGLGCVPCDSAAITVFIPYGDTIGHRDGELVAPSQ